MEKKNFLKVVVTGPESTGKTALAEALAQRLGVAWVPEFARYYVAHLGRPYRREDLKAIGLGQSVWEQWYALKFAEDSYANLLVCDTDWTVLHVWEEYRFRPDDAPEWQKGYGPAHLADLYLLCAPDFPWQPDPLREHPDERDALFDLYEELLHGRQANFITLTGGHEMRLQIALSAIRKLF
ncbi:MAG: ATP-binding protein [Saprospiraceae bacterium]|nr:ATP-binding protein [Saprospiraceae bacterium]